VVITMRVLASSTNQETRVPSIQQVLSKPDIPHLLIPMLMIAPSVSNSMQTTIQHVIWRCYPPSFSLLEMRCQGIGMQLVACLVRMQQSTPLCNCFDSTCSNFVVRGAPSCLWPFKGNWYATGGTPYWHE
jgi:hypothetical protein